MIEHDKDQIYALIQQAREQAEQVTDVRANRTGWNRIQVRLNDIDRNLQYRPHSRKEVI